MTADSTGPALIGIDIGTSSIRAIAFDQAGRRLAVSAQPTPLQTAETGGEYDPDAVFGAVVGTVSEVGVALRGRPVAGIGVASIGESCVLVDEIGRAVAPSIAWFDRRTEPIARGIRRQVGADRVFAITGLAVEPIFTLAKLAWMRAHWADAFIRARRVLMMADWIAYRLSGEAATDPTLASRTLYFDITRRRWSPELLAFVGRDPSFAAPLAASGTALGPLRSDIQSETGLAGRPVVAVGGHDHLLGAFAAGLTEPGIVVDSVGTAEALLLAGDEHASDEPPADADVIRRGYVQGAIETDRRMHYFGASLFSSGGAMEWVRTLVGGIPAATLIEEARAIPVGCDGVVFLPHLANAPPPNPDPNARGAFFGLTPATTPGVLYRAVLEGLAIQSRLMLDGMRALPGVDLPRQIRLIGGVSRNPLFLSIKANVFGRPLIVVEEPEATALGAGLLGGMAAGLFSSLDLAVAGLDHRTYTIEPDENVERYDQLRTLAFKRIHGLTRSINRDLGKFRQVTVD